MNPIESHPGHFAKLDPQIETFLQRMTESTLRYPRRDKVTIAEARQHCELIREPWAQGGPEMARTEEREVPTRHGAVRIRVHHPRERRLDGALFYIHGGGFVLFSLDTHDRVMREYAERAGITVIGIDYTRAPDCRFPRPLEECADVVDWVGRHGAELGVNPEQLFIGGDSAGANLSLGTCILRRDKGQAPLSGMILNYGAFSTDVYRDSMVRYGGGEYGLSLHMMVWFYRTYLSRPEELTHPLVNLVDADLRGLPPAFMAITECDPLHDDSMEVAAKLRASGVDTAATVYPGTIHSFLEAVSIADVAVQAFEDTCQWIRTRCRA